MYKSIILLLKIKLKKGKRYKNILLGREVIADFCYQTGPLTQLKEVRKTFTKHSMGKPL